MRPVTAARAVFAGVLFAVALFCVYGVLATLEPDPRAIPFRLLYLITGAAALSVGAWLLYFKK